MGKIILFQVLVIFFMLVYKLIKKIEKSSFAKLSEHQILGSLHHVPPYKAYHVYNFLANKESQ